MQLIVQKDDEESREGGHNYNDYDYHSSILAVAPSELMGLMFFFCCYCSRRTKGGREYAGDTGKGLHRISIYIYIRLCLIEVAVSAL